MLLNGWGRFATSGCSSRRLSAERTSKREQKYRMRIEKRPWRFPWGICRGICVCGENFAIRILSGSAKICILTCSDNRKHHTSAGFDCRRVLRRIPRVHSAGSWCMSPTWGRRADPWASHRSQRTSCRARRKQDQWTFHSVGVSERRISHDITLWISFEPWPEKVITNREPQIVFVIRSDGLGANHLTSSAAWLWNFWPRNILRKRRKQRTATPWTNNNGGPNGRVYDKL